MSARWHLVVCVLIGSACGREVHLGSGTEAAARAADGIAATVNSLFTPPSPADGVVTCRSESRQTVHDAALRTIKEREFSIVLRHCESVRSSQEKVDLLGLLAVSVLSEQPLEQAFQGKVAFEGGLTDSLELNLKRRVEGRSTRLSGLVLIHKSGPFPGEPQGVTFDRYEVSDGEIPAQ